MDHHFLLRHCPIQSTDSPTLTSQEIQEPKTSVPLLSLFQDRWTSFQDSSKTLQDAPRRSNVLSQSPGLSAELRLHEHHESISHLNSNEPEPSTSWNHRPLAHHHIYPVLPCTGVRSHDKPLEAKKCLVVSPKTIIILPIPTTY